MKTDIAYYLLILYVTVILKPLVPVLCDIWSHEFSEIEHISTVHAKYGGHHLQKDLENNGSEKNQSTLKFDDQVSFHVAKDEYKLHDKCFLIDKEFFPLQIHKPYPVFISKHIPPPKFS